MKRVETSLWRRWRFRHNRRSGKELLSEQLENDAVVESQRLRICTQPGPRVETTVRWKIVALECRQTFDPNLGFVSQLFERETAALAGFPK